MEIRIGLVHSPAVLAFESDAEPDEIAEAITAGWANGELVSLMDKKGSRIMVPTDKITFVELGASTRGKVGFGQQ